MAQSLDAFIAELRGDVERFEQAYRTRMAEKPDQYPVTLPDGQEGLWFEFFMDFVTNHAI
ncbi:hypothetical protein [Cupriavidus sp. BIC8F]|uniref:hypothetical protein n=1 Tax=Cupriavidus sp. BIC8F TaxID=3079014 RepID=UPI00291635F3|nr:hypothetical protein [Cupriavidus sp. BIC8F]